MVQLKSWMTENIVFLLLFVQTPKYAGEPNVSYFNLGNVDRGHDVIMT